MAAKKKAAKKKAAKPESKAERQERLKARKEKDIAPPHDKHADKQESGETDAE